MTVFSFEALGVQQASRRFDRMGAAALNMAPAWEEILQFFFWIEDATFQSQGRRGGGEWAQDTTDWLIRKSNDGLDPRINFATWTLYDSMTLPGAEGQVVEISNTSLKFGSDLPQAGPSQKFRPYIKLTKMDRYTMAKTIGEYFKAAWSS